MSGGGDTPSKTLWKLQQEQRVTFGEFQNGLVSIEGPSENQIFVADTEGKISELQDFIPALIPQLKEVFAPYFGEEIDIQVLPVTGLAIGDDVPNWDLYEQLN